MTFFFSTILTQHQSSTRTCQGFPLSLRLKLSGYVIITTMIIIINRIILIIIIIIIIHIVDGGHVWGALVASVDSLPRFLAGPSRWSGDRHAGAQPHLSIRAPARSLLQSSRLQTVEGEIGGKEGGLFVVN